MCNKENQQNAVRPQATKSKKKHLSRETKKKICKILIPIVGVAELVLKFLIWGTIISIIIILTRLSTGSWQALADILFGDLTTMSILRDICLVLIGGAFINSIKKTIKDLFGKKDE